MKEEIKDILNDLKDSAKNPTYVETDIFSDEAYEVPNYFTLDPTNGGSKTLLNYIENLQSQLKAKEEAEKEFKKFLEDNWNESQDIWFIKLLNKYEEITSKQAKENDEILSKGEKE